MASAYSIARTYNEFVPPVDLQLFASALAQKQQQFDTNYAMIQAQIEMPIDIIKEADQKYYADRMKSIVDELNSYGKIDLSSSSVARQVSRHVGQVIDDNVRNAVTSTRIKREFDANMEALKKSNKEAYNAINEMHALKGFKEYMENDNVGEMLKPIQYVEYRDVQGKMNKLLMESFKLWGETEIQSATEDPWTFLETKVKGLKKEQIRQHVLANLDANDRAQLEINGWYNNGLSTPERSQEVLNEYISVRNENIDYAIEQLTKSKQDATKTQKKYIDNQIEIFNRDKENNKQVLEKLKTPEQIGAYMEMEKMITGFQEMYQEREVSRKYTPNQAYANRMRYNLDLDKFKLSAMEYELKRQQYEDSLTLPDTDAIQPNDMSGQELVGLFGKTIQAAQEVDSSIDAALTKNGLSSEGYRTQSDKLDDLAEVDPEQAAILRTQYTITNQPLIAMNKKVDNLLQNYEKIVGKGNILGYIRAQWDKADTANKKVLEYVFEYAKTGYLKLPPASIAAPTTVQQGITNVMNMDFTDPNSYRGVGLSADSKIENVAPYKKYTEGSVDISVPKALASYTPKTSFKQKRDKEGNIYLEAGDSVYKSTQQVLSDFPFLSDVDLSLFFSNNSGFTKKAAITNEINRKIQEKHYKDLFPNVTDRQLSGLVEGNANIRNKMLSELTVGMSSPDPTTQILRDILADSGVIENYRGKTVSPKGAGISEQQAALHTELVNYINTNDVLLSDTQTKFNAKEPFAFVVSPDKSKIYFYQYIERTKDGRKIKDKLETSSISIDNIPPTLSRLIGTQDPVFVTEGDYPIVDYSKLSFQQKQMFGNERLGGFYKDITNKFNDLKPEEKEGIELDTAKLKDITSNPQGYKVLLDNMVLKVVNNQNVNDVVYTFDNLSPQEASDYFLNQNFIHTPAIILMMLDDLSKRMSQYGAYAIPKTLLK